MLCEGGLTVCVTRKWVGVDSLWEQKKLEARKLLKKAAESHLSGARFVGQPANQNDGRKKTPPQTRQDFTRNFDFYQNQKNCDLQNACWKKTLLNKPERKFWKNQHNQKNYNANETEIILQTQLTRTFAEKRRADFENLARRKSDFAKRNRLDQSKPNLNKNAGKRKQADFGNL